VLARGVGERIGIPFTLVHARLAIGGAKRLGGRESVALS
jgi:hypothetical protein